MDGKQSAIGRRIYDLRIEHDIQQGELASAINIHQSVLNRIEKGSRPARDTEIRDIALYFGISADSLLCMPGMPSRDNSHHVLSDEELVLLKKYRALDARGKHAVDDTINREFCYV